MVRLTIIIILVALQAALGAPAVLSEGPYIVRASLYSFFHAGWLHLAVNCIAVWSVYRPGSCRSVRDIIIPLTIAVAVYPLSLRPAIGFSNVIYATLGLRTPALGSPWWRRTEVAVFIAVTLAMALVPRISATTHIAAFLLGMLGATIARSIDNVMRDAGRHL